MSTTYYLRKPISVSDMESKTEIQANQTARTLALENHSISADFSADGTYILHLKRYSGMEIAKIIQDLALKVGAEIMSEYAIREYIENDEPIPESSWKAYTASIIDSIKNPE